jgi:hypothetical protein
MASSDQQSLLAQVLAQLTNQHARLDALDHQLAAVTQENAQLKTALAQTEQRLAALPVVPPSTAAAPVSRRGLLTGALGAAAATIGAGVGLDALDQGTAAAATGSSLLLGKNNYAEYTTQVAYDGGTFPLSGKIVFFVNDTTLASTTATYPAAIAGWAGGGKAGVSTGVFGKSNGTNGNGVVGLDVGSGSSGVGVRAMTYSGTAIIGTSASTAANANAVLGLISSTSPGTSSTAIRGQNNGTGYNGIGVYGSHAGSGYGVYGTASSGYGVFGTASSGYGVIGTSTSGYGIYASSGGSAGIYAYVSGSGTGVRGVTSSGIGVYGSSTSNYGVYGTSSGAYGVIGTSSSGNGVYGQTSTAPQAGVIGRTFDASGNWAIYGFGNIGATGTKSALVPAENGTHRTLYCIESPECWFEDFGAAQLSGGTAQVQLDPLFAATIHSELYYIFLTPEGESKGLYVSAKTPTGFVVREVQGGTSTLAFSYRIVARRKDVAVQRLAQVVLPSPADVSPSPGNATTTPELPTPQPPPPPVATT